MYIYMDRIFQNNKGECFTGEYLQNNHLDINRYIPINIYDLHDKTEITCNYSQLFKDTDNMIYSSDILYDSEYDCDLIGGNDYNSETEEYKTIFQAFIIDDNLTRFLKVHTHEIIYRMHTYSLNVLGVTHYGTSWDYVPATFIV